MDRWGIGWAGGRAGWRVSRRDNLWMGGRAIDGRAEEWRPCWPVGELVDGKTDILRECGKAEWHRSGKMAGMRLK